MNLPRNFDVAVGAVMMVADVGGVMDDDEVVVVVFEPKSLIGVLVGGIVRFISFLKFLLVVILPKAPLRMQLCSS